jgi:hypothetical protein
MCMGCQSGFLRFNLNSISRINTFQIRKIYDFITCISSPRHDLGHFGYLLKQANTSRGLPGAQTSNPAPHWSDFDFCFKPLKTSGPPRSRTPIVAIDLGFFPISLNLTKKSAIFIVHLENLFKNDLGSFSSLPPNSVLLVGPCQAAPSGIFRT